MCFECVKLSHDLNDRKEQAMQTWGNVISGCEYSQGKGPKVKQSSDDIRVRNGSCYAELCI